MSCGPPPTTPGAERALTVALSGKPYNEATVAQRAAIAHQLAGDPVSRGSSLLLALAAGLALLVAAVAVVLLVSGDRRDDAGELHAWESDGVRPATLRRMLLIRALSVVAVGIPIGLAAGLLLAHVGANVVAVDASGADTGASAARPGGAAVVERPAGDRVGVGSRHRRARCGTCAA